VQLYIRDKVSSVTTYDSVLRGFERVTLKPGQVREVEFTVPFKEMALLNKEMKWVVEAGEFEFMAGSSSEDIRLTVTASYSGI
jgi:beta-glucosidase